MRDRLCGDTAPAHTPCPAAEKPHLHPSLQARGQGQQRRPQQARLVHPAGGRWSWHSPFSKAREVTPATGARPLLRPRRGGRVCPDPWQGDKALPQPGPVVEVGRLPLGSCRSSKQERCPHGADSQGNAREGPAPRGRGQVPGVVSPAAAAIAGIRALGSELTAAVAARRPTRSTFVLGLSVNMPRCCPPTPRGQRPLLVIGLLLGLGWRRLHAPLQGQYGREGPRGGRPWRPGPLEPRTLSLKLPRRT